MQKDMYRREQHCLTTSIVTDVAIVVVLSLEELQAGKNLVLRFALGLWRSWKRNVGDLALAAFPSPFGDGLEGRRVTSKVIGIIASAAPNHIFSTTAVLRTFDAFGLWTDHRNPDGLVLLLLFILPVAFRRDDCQQIVPYARLGSLTSIASPATSSLMVQRLAVLVKVLVAGSAQNGGLLVNITVLGAGHASRPGLVNRHLDSLAGFCRFTTDTADGNHLGRLTSLLPTSFGTRRSTLLATSGQMLLQIKSSG